METMALLLKKIPLSVPEYLSNPLKLAVKKCYFYFLNFTVSLYSACFIKNGLCVNKVLKKV